MSDKCFLLLLHAHMPYGFYEKPGYYLEERWFYEALTDSYLPLLEIMEGWVRDGLDFRLTLSLSPSLLSMLTDQRMQERYLVYLRDLVELAEREVERTRKESPEFYPLAHFYRDRYIARKEQYIALKCDLISPLKRLGETDKLELITCAATHAYLPLIKEDTLKIAQIRAARKYFKALFDISPKSFWLPECGFTPGLDSLLAGEGINCIFLDSQGFLKTDLEWQGKSYFPVKSPSAGISVFLRDLKASSQVWNSLDGYPGDPFYREYYRDIGFDLSADKLAPFIPYGQALPSGIKYYRITNRGSFKQSYRPEAARERVGEHARHFLSVLQQQLDINPPSGCPPVVATPFDAELFGHWWFEGPLWLDRLIRLLNNQDEITMVTPQEYLKEYPPGWDANLHLSSWGQGGCNEVWLNKKNDFFYPVLHGAEKRITGLCRDYYGYSNDGKDHPLLKLLDRYLELYVLTREKTGEKNASAAIKAEERVLGQALKELFLAQSSDWAFMLSWQKTEDVALHRFQKHMDRFNLLCDMYSEGNYAEEKLEECEREDSLLGRLPAGGDTKLAFMKLEQQNKQRVLFLTWEFPPRIIGGLARHVAGLSQALAAEGIQPFVVTMPFKEGFSREENCQGVTIFRVSPLTGSEENQGLLEWVASLNASLYREGAALLKSWPRPFPAVIHAHDWLVGPCATALQEEFGLPLVVTIHSTEWGRRRGLFTELHHQIHNLEKDLALKADLVICCSRYMKEEIIKALSVPEQKVEILPNGVNLEDLQQYRVPEENYMSAGKKIIFFVGRLVYEKGVHLLIEAASLVVKHFPEVCFIVAGTGPQKTFLQKMVIAAGLQDKVFFAGFIDDELRNYYYRMAEVAVFPSLYEPFGIVALEAMAAGAPVIVADSGGLGEIIGCGEGLKFPPGNSRALAGCILKLLQNERLKEKFRERGKEKAREDYRWSAVARRTAEIYTAFSGEVS
jgi:1,4-alpha-glucan branching enzyme